MSKLELVPISQREAFAWVKRTHRHLSPPVGDLYRVSLMDTDINYVWAVGMAGRPCRMLQDGRTAEITRIASIAPVKMNACSVLYGALRRAGIALGYRRFVTYTLAGEPGVSLRAAGFEDDGLTDGGEWSRPSRVRAPVERSDRKRRWLYPARASGLWTHAYGAKLPKQRSKEQAADDEYFLYGTRYPGQ